MNRLLPLTLGGVLLSVLVHAESPLRLETTLEPRTATVGDPLRLVVRAVAEPGVGVHPFVPGNALGSFEVVHFVPGTPRTDNGRVTQEFQWTLTCFDVGVSTVPPVTFSYQVAGGKTEEIHTPEIPVTMRSVVPPEARGIRGLKKPWPGPIPWLVWAGVALATIGCIGAGVWWGRRRRARRPPPPPRPCHVKALEELEYLEQNPPETARVFYTRLSGIVRVYVEGRFLLPAPDLTTGEIMDALKKTGLSSSVRRTARDLLESSDLVKFARFEYDPAGRREHLSIARGFVHSTRPPDIGADLP